MESNVIVVSLKGTIGAIDEIVCHNADVKIHQINKYRVSLTVNDNNFVFQAEPAKGTPIVIEDLVKSVYMYTYNIEFKSTYIHIEKMDENIYWIGFPDYSYNIIQKTTPHRRRPIINLRHNG